MAKGQISDEELSSGLKGLGGFGALGGSRVIKDSPFRDSRTETKVIEVPRPVPVRAVMAESALVQPAQPLVQEPKPARTRPAAKPAATARKTSEPETKEGRRVADIHTERVTLQMSPELRDRVDALARGLQRAKTSKGERITANTVMRVAICALLDSFELKTGDAPNNEDELLRLVKARKN